MHQLDNKVFDITDARCNHEVHGNEIVSRQVKSACYTIKQTFGPCSRELVNILVIWHVLHPVLNLMGRNNRITHVHTRSACPNVNHTSSMFHFWWQMQMNFILEHRNNDCTFRKNLKTNYLDDKLMNKYIGWLTTALYSRINEWVLINKSVRWYKYRNIWKPMDRWVK